MKMKNLNSNGLGFRLSSAAAAAASAVDVIAHGRSLLFSTTPPPFVLPGEVCSALAVENLGV